MKTLLALALISLPAAAFAATEHDLLCELDGSAANVDYTRDPGCQKKPDANACGADQKAYIAKLGAADQLLHSDNGSERDAIPTGGWASERAVGYFQMFQINGDKSALKAKVDEQAKVIADLRAAAVAYQSDCSEAVRQAYDAMFGTKSKLAAIGLDRARWNQEGKPTEQLRQELQDIAAAAGNLGRAARN